VTEPVLILKAGYGIPSEQSGKGAYWGNSEKKKKKKDD